MVKWISENAVGEDVVISSRIRLARNIKNHRFPNLFDRQEAEQIDSIFVNALIKEELGIYSHTRLKDLNLITRRVLMENHLISPELIKNKDFSSFLLRKDEMINLLINEEDHLRLQVLVPGFDLNYAYQEASKMEEKLEETIDFAYHDEFGYLTACPTNTGTGLRASVMVHLPGMTATGKLKGLSDSLGKLGLTVRGLYGEGSEALGDMYQISNQRTLGMNEESAIEKLENIVHRIISNEREIRRNQMKKNPVDMEDMIFRGLGTLKYAKKIDMKETLTCLSSLRMGIDMKLYRGLTIKQVTELMFRVQKYNILHYKELNHLPAPENVIRANYINTFFKEEERDG